MNTQQLRLHNTQHILTLQRGGTRVNPFDYRIGESLRVIRDVELQVDGSILSVPEGTIGKITRGHTTEVSVDLGEALGGVYILPLSEVGKYFERVRKVETKTLDRRRVIAEANPTIATPGRYVQITSYDPTIGPNRGPKSPGQGGYVNLVGQKGMIATLFGLINGIKTYKIQLMQGGEFVFGETEFTVIAESAPKAGKTLNERALHGLGYGL